MNAWVAFLGIAGVAWAAWGVGHEMGERKARREHNAEANYAAKVRRSTMHNVTGGRSL